MIFENILMGEKDGCEGSILCLFGQGNFIFIREKSGNFPHLCLRQPCIWGPVVCYENQ